MNEGTFFQTINQYAYPRVMAGETVNSAVDAGYEITELIALRARSLSAKFEEMEKGGEGEPANGAIPAQPIKAKAGK